MGHVKVTLKFLSLISSFLPYLLNCLLPYLLAYWHTYLRTYLLIPYLLHGEQSFLRS